MKITYTVRSRGNEQYDVFKNGEFDCCLSSTDLRNDQRFYRNNAREFADFRRKLDQQGEAKTIFQATVARKGGSGSL